MLEAIWIEQMEAPSVGPREPEPYGVVERGTPTDCRQQQQAAAALERDLEQALSDADKDGRADLATLNDPQARIVIYRIVLQRPGIHRYKEAAPRVRELFGDQIKARPSLFDRTTVDQHRYAFKEAGRQLR